MGKKKTKDLMIALREEEAAVNKAHMIVERPKWAESVDLGYLNQKLIKLEQRIDRIVDAIDKSKKVRGL